MGRVSQPIPSVKSTSQVKMLMMLVPIFFLIIQGTAFLDPSQFLPSGSFGGVQTKPENMNVNMNGVDMSIGKHGSADSEWWRRRNTRKIQRGKAVQQRGREGKGVQQREGK